ncbi:MAG: PA14 domain-containing protein [Paracoccaceae bacterium]|nr:PA14 domain-containing protein [Paracoccaceae bacterium]
MNFALKSAAVALALLIPSLALSDTLQLSPASPQPSAGSLKSGLAVKYAFKNHGSSLADAKSVLKKAKPGTALVGLSYDDTVAGDNVLTTEQSEKIAAAISGYIKFPSAGTYMLEFLANDGLEISIGGQQVGRYDGIHPCGYVGEQEVQVPQAGYYPLEATYFQRKGTACLLMEWGPDSDGLEQVPDSAFFH